MSENAKSHANVTRFTKRWSEKIATRKDRTMDDRDKTLAEGLRLVEQRSNANFPYVTSLSFVMLSAGQMYSLAINGANLIGDAEKADGSTSDSTGQLDFEAVVPGDQTITIDLEDDGGAITVTADRSAGTIDITHNGDTAADILAAVNADAIARYMVQATQGAAGAIDADEVVTVKCTSADPGTLPILHVGGVNVTGSTALSGVHSWTDSQILFDINASAFSLDALHAMRLWADDVLCFEQSLEVDSWEMDQIFPLASGGTLPAPNAKDMETANITGDYQDDVPAYVITSDATSEGQSGQLTHGDQLTINPAKNPVFEAWVELTPAGATFTADERVVVGLVSPHTNAEDALDSATNNVWFRMEGANLNVLVEADDGTTDTDDQDSGIDWVKGQLHHFKIDMANLSDIKFYVDGVEQTGAAVAASALSASLQPIFCVQRDAGTEVNTVEVKRYRVRQAL